MDTDFKISLGALGFVNVIGINDNEFAWNQGVLFPFIVMSAEPLRIYSSSMAGCQWLGT